MARICPACTVSLKAETVHGVSLDVCPQCAGIWFDAEELRTLLARDPLALDMIEDRAVPAIEQKTGDPSIHRCPDCALPLQQYHYLYTSPIVLDNCAECGGLWVEDGELEKMQRSWEQIHKPMTTKEKAGIALAEITIAHDNEMKRQNKLLRLFEMLRQYRPGWLV